MKTPVSYSEKLLLQSNKFNRQNIKNLENIDKNDEPAETSSLFVVKFNYYRHRIIIKGSIKYCSVPL